MRTGVRHPSRDTNDLQDFRNILGGIKHAAWTLDSASTGYSVRSNDAGYMKYDSQHQQDGERYGVQKG
jgi:hypothetical protein